MSEINTVFHKSSKQLLSLAKSLTNNTALQDKVLESLLIKRNVETIKRRKLKHKFSTHPDPLSSESETLVDPVRNGYSDSSLSFNYNKSCDISVTHSEHNVLVNNFMKLPKSPERIYFPPNQSFCAETQISVHSQKTEATTQKTVESVSLKKVHQLSSEYPRKLQNAISKMQSNKLYSKVGVPNKSLEVSSAKNVFHMKNIDHNLGSYLQRIISCMEDIRIIMVKGTEPPDGAEDWERARIRTVEFASRFSRNYLYQLGREMTDLQETTTRSGSMSHRTTRNIHQRLLTTHQVVLQALQAYRSHMTTLLANALAERLQYIVEQTCILCNIHTEYLNLGQTGSTKRESLIDTLTKKCNVLLDTIQDAVVKRGQINNMLHSPATKLSLMGYNVKLTKPGKPKLRKKLPVEARLSMYSISARIQSKDAFWKKTFETLAKDKLRYNHVQSRYKTASFKHRPPTEKPTGIELHTKSKLFSKRSSCLLRNTPINTPENEDEILTLVEMQKEKEYNSSNVVKSIPHVTDCGQQLNNVNSVRDTQLQALTPLIQDLCQQVCSKNGEAMTQKRLEILLKGVLGMALDGKINNNDDDKKNGSKKNGFVPHSDPVDEIAQKILQNVQQMPSNSLPNKNLLKSDEHERKCEEILEQRAEVETLKEVESEPTIKNKKSFSKKAKNSVSSTGVSEKANVRPGEKSKNNNINCHVEEISKGNKVEFEEIHTDKAKKADNSQVSTNKNKRRQTVTVTGAKNAQLICIRDEDSIIESVDESKTFPVSSKSKNEQIKEDSAVKDAVVLSEQGNIQKNDKKNSAKPSNNNITNKQKAKDDKSSKVSIKISRLPKKLLKQLVLIPKTQAFNVIQYKLQYSKFTRGNHMYRKSSKVQPWVIVDKISEHLLNELLLSIAREIQVDQIVESLYHSEFQ